MPPVSRAAFQVKLKSFRLIPVPWYFAYYFSELLAHQDDSVWIELTELLAIVSGAFMLRGHNWARWLALAWMAFHVAISFPVYRQMAIHLIIFAGIAWVLFRVDTRRYFAIRKPDGE